MILCLLYSNLFCFIIVLLFHFISLHFNFVYFLFFVRFILFISIYFILIDLCNFTLFFCLFWIIYSHIYSYIFCYFRAAASSISLPAALLTKVRKFCDQMESPATMFGIDEQSSLKKETLPDTEFLKVRTTYHLFLFLKISTIFFRLFDYLSWFCLLFYYTMKYLLSIIVVWMIW